MKNFDGKDDCHRDSGDRQSRRSSEPPRAAAKQSYARPQRTPAETIPADEQNKLITLFYAGQYAELENRGRILVKKHPNSGFIWKVLGVSLLSQGKDALSALKKTTILLPQDAEAHNNLGVALRDQGQLHDALASFQRALAHRPEYAEAFNNRGIALQYLGQLDKAAQHFRRALEIKPLYPEAYNNLGNALQLMGKLDDAVASYQHALDLQPNQAKAHNNLGNAWQSLGRLDDAMASYMAALKIDANYAEAHCNLGNALTSAGNMEAALVSCRRALEINPEYAEAHHNLGIVLEGMGQHDAAIASFRRALKFDPRLAKAHSGLGSALRTYDHTEAEAHCRKALAIDSNLVDAVIVLGELMIDNAKFDEAEQLFRRAILMNPDAPEAWAGIAGLRKMTHDDADWLNNAERIVKQNIPPRKETALHYAIGKYYDDVKEYDSAFPHYRRANELTKGYGLQFNKENHTLAFNTIIQNYRREWVCQERQHANTSTLPVLIVGMPRSGTSLVEQIIASHPSAHGAGELPFWNKVMNAITPSVLIGEGGEALLSELADQYVKVLRNQAVDALCVVDKMPSNFQYLGAIHAALPHARIIHMQRNPIDTCLSIYFQNFAVHHSYSNDLEDLFHYYKEYERLMKHWRQTLPDNAMLEVPYESLVADQEGWSRKILEFIGLPWDDRCIDFHQHARTVATASNWQVRQKIGKASVERWRNYEKFVGPLLHLLGQDQLTII